MPLSSALISTRAIYPDRSQIPIQITHASGISVFDTDQREYLDAALGSGSIILGHGDEEIIGILTEQARRLTIHPGAGFAYELVDRYAERLIGFAPSGYDRVCLATSGSDAVEMAIKLALQYHYHRGETLRTKIIGREASYHGNTLAGLSAGHFLSRRAPYEATFPPNARGACALCTKCQFHQSPASCALECATSLATAIEQEGPESVAAVILEPVVGAALSGAVPDPRYLGRVREICDHYGVLFIVDEVMTGFGRTGEPFAVGHWDITPDVIICGKAMSAGYYPLSGILISTKLSDVVEAAGLPLQHGQTHSGNPVGAAVGLAVIDRIEQGNLLQNAASMGAILRDEIGRASCRERVLMPV